MNCKIDKCIHYCIKKFKNKKKGRVSLREVPKTNCPVDVVRW